MDKDARGNVSGNTDDYSTSIDKVFAAADMRRGQSLVVWAIREGRQCAHAIDMWLMGSSELAAYNKSMGSYMVRPTLQEYKSMKNQWGQTRLI